MRSQEKVCATLFRVWVRTLDEPFIGEGAGEGEEPSEEKCAALAAPASKKGGGGSILIKQQKGEKGVRRVEAASLGPVGKKEGMGAGGGAG